MPGEGLRGDQTTEMVVYPLYQRDIYGSYTLVRIKLLKWMALTSKGENLFSAFIGK